MDERLENEKIGSLLFSLALPSIIAQLTTLVYNIVDRIYIGRLPDNGLSIAGVGICASIVTIITAFTNLFGRGGAPLASIKLGEKKHDEAEHILGNCFMSLMMTSMIIMFILYFFGEDILLLFGASKNTLPYALSYLNVYLFGTIFAQLSVGLNYFINTQGFAKYGMVTLLVGGILNIILDPVFIFVFDMGVSGAALATVISQLVSCIWVLLFLFGKRTTLKIKAKYMKLDFGIMKSVLALGLSPFFMLSTEGILQISFNRQLLFYGGDIAVSAMTILMSLLQVLNLPLEGIAQGAQPIISYNYGAKKNQRVKETISLTLKVAFTFSFIGASLMILFPKLFVGLFTSSDELLDLAYQLLRIYVFGFLIMGAFSTFQQSYTALGFGGRSFAFAFIRKIILLIPLIYLLPHLLPWGVFAVILAEPLSDMTATIADTLYFRHFMKKELAD